MRKRKAVAVLVYFTAGFCLEGYIEFLAGLEPIAIRHSLYGLVAGTALIGIACALSFFRLRWAAVCALSGAAVSWPLLWRQFLMTFGPDGLWVLTYHPDTSAAVVSLIVSTGYAVLQLWPLLRSEAGPSKPKAIWVLPVATVYTMTLLGVANWPNIWSLFFKLRHGS